MDFVTLFFAVAVAWFSFIFFRIASWVYQFKIYPSTFGVTTNISLNDLADLSRELRQELPSFNIVIPAYDESLVIDGTLRRMAAINYPQTHFSVFVVTYEDEPCELGQPTTYDTALAAAAEINGEVGRDLVQVLSVPATYDGRFPGNLNAKDRFVGKPRGLNYAIRRIHEKNEREERGLFIGRMARLGHLEALDLANDAVSNVLANPAALAEAANRFFDPASRDYVGASTLLRQVTRLAGILSRIDGETDHQKKAAGILSAYISREAPRFFLSFTPPEVTSGAASTRDLVVMSDRRFLYDVMREVEEQRTDILATTCKQFEMRLAGERPILWQALEQTQDGARLYELVRQVNSRWLATYDADADVPIDLFRHLSARILTEPETMGFQGPVSPVSNYDEVHPLCKLGGLSMAFWHNTGYPQLFSKDNWAHVLAGTNWCFRIDGTRQGDKLVRETEYDETARYFILSFDPGHLTEDLEVAVRMFDEWQVNAQWHPYSEFEQVPASKKAMIVQRRRWTLGTLQTIAYMLRSRLPLMQKLKYGLRPLDIATSGSGPVVTVLLIYFIYRGDLISNPATIAWSLVLTVANLMYVLPFLQTYERFVLSLRRSLAVEGLITSGPPLLRDTKTHLRHRAFSPEECHLMHDITVLLDGGLQSGGPIRHYLASRCLDDPPVDAYARALTDATPSNLQRTHLTDLSDEFSRLTARAYVSQGPENSGDAELVARLEDMKSSLQKACMESAWKARRRTERRQIWLWAFVYLFWQLVPSYMGLLDWLKGGKDKTWIKTPRTRKHKTADAD